MCGIAGIICQNISENELNRLQEMSNSIIHRGPDEEGNISFKNAALSHRRLSIIDLATGKQPMQTNDGRYTISYNGEVYNFKTIRKELQDLGYIFSTNSDTEVILYGYAAWGDKIFNKLRGMFAFSIWDNIKNECHLVRDRYGIKPLFYQIENNCLVFCSELRPLVENQITKPIGSLESLEYFLRYSYIPAPLTIYKNIYKLLPGHFITYNPQRKEVSIKQHSYTVQESWGEKDDQISSRSISDAIDESVSAHLVADVPFGAFLSGGIDSTIVVSAMHKKLGNSFATFAIGFKDSNYNELQFAEKVAKKLDLNLYTKIVDENDITILNDIIEHYGEPFGDSSVIPTWNVCKLAKSKVTMVLSGDGGDEFFGGYTTYKNWLNYSPQKYLVSKLINKELYKFTRGSLGYTRKWMKEGFSTNFLEEWEQKFRYSESELRSALWKNKYSNVIHHASDLFETYHKKAKKFHRLDYAQYMDIHTNMPGHILPKVDTASMLNSLEVRTPLIDMEIHKLCRQIPFQIKYSSKSDSPGKKVLKELIEKDYGSDFVYRNKQGFSIPKYKWFYNGNVASDLLKDIIAKKSNAVNELFNTEIIIELLNLHNKKEVDYSNILWLILVFGIWSEQNASINFVD